MIDLRHDGPALEFARALLLLGAFWSAYGTLRSHPRARVMLCRTIAVALPALPLLALVPGPALLHLPAFTRPVPPIPVAARTWPSSPAGKSTAAAKTSAPIENPLRATNTAASQPAPKLTGSGLLFFIWGLGSAGLLVRWLVALELARQWSRTAEKPPAWAGEIQAEIALRLDLAARVRLGVIDDAGSPLLLGPRPLILLPRHLVEEDAPDDFVPSLAHEMVHVKEGDWWWSQWLRVVTALLWPAPPVWWLRRAHDASAEIVCDSIAAAVIGGAEAYAGTLARQSLRALGRPRLVAIPMVRRSGVRQRIDRLVSGLALPPFSRRAMVMTGAIAVLACGALCGIRAAGDAPPAAPSPVPAPIAVAPTPAAPSATREIEPYGGITWNDGLFQVIQKIRKIDGITTIVWESSHAKVVSPVDLTSITTPAELSTALEKRIAESMSHVTYIRGLLSPYKDAAGHDQKYLSEIDALGSELSAGPVILAGHPFTLFIEFTAHPGFAAEFPDQVIALPDEGAIASLAITSVALKTDTALSDESRDAIADKLIAKYHVTDPNALRNLKQRGDLNINDRGPATLEFFSNITYSYDSRGDLDKYYANLLTRLAEESAQKKPDGINGL